MASRPHQHRWLRCLSPSAAGSDTRAEKSSFSALGDWHCLAWIRHSTDASASANTCKHRCPDGSTTTPNCSGSRAPSRQTLQHRRYRGTCWQAGAGTGWSWPRGLCQHSCLPPRVRIGLDTSSCLRQGHRAPSAHSFSCTSPPPHTPCVSPANFVETKVHQLPDEMALGSPSFLHSSPFSHSAHVYWAPTMCQALSRALGMWS